MGNSSSALILSKTGSNLSGHRQYTDKQHSHPPPPPQSSPSNALTINIKLYYLLNLQPQTKQSGHFVTFTLLCLYKSNFKEHSEVVQDYTPEGWGGGGGWGLLPYKSERDAHQKIKIKLLVVVVVFFFSQYHVIVMYQFSILNCFIFSYWRAVFIRKFSFPLLLSFIYCTFLYIYIYFYFVHW